LRIPYRLRTIRSKTLAIIGVTLAVFLGALYIVSRMVLLGSYAKLEEQGAKRNVDRVRSALADELATLDSLCKDSAIYDNAYAFVGNGNPEFVRSNIGSGPLSSLAVRRLNLMIYIQPSGRIVFGEGFDLKAEKETSMPEGIREHLVPASPLLRHKRRDSGVAGILMLPEGPMLVSSWPILNTRGDAPSRGSLVIGRYLDSAEIQSISEKTHLSLTVVPFENALMRNLFSRQNSAPLDEGPVVEPLNNDFIAGYGLLKDIDGKPALALQITMPREIYNQGRSTIVYFVGVLLAGGLVAGLFTLLLLEIVVLSRVANLSAGVLAVGETANLSARVPMNGTDELSHLAGAVNRMLQALEGSRQLERESEERYRLLFERNQAGVFRCTEAGKIVDGNEALAGILGHASREEMLAHSVWEAQWGGADTAPFLMALKERGVISNWEARLQRKDGSPAWVLASGTLLESGIIEGTMIDITELKQSEAEHLRLVTAIEQSAEAVVITDTTGAIEYVNPAFTRITEYTRAEVMGQNVRILKSGRQSPDVYEQLWKTVLAGKAWHGELINQRKSGSLYTEQMYITPIRDEHGEVTHFIATKQDVTEHKSMEAQLEQAARIESVGRLAGGIAHDFNNLLTVINGYSDLLLDQFAPDHVVSAHVKEIRHAGDRAAALTHQLLAFSRRQVLDPQVLNLNSVVTHLETMLKRLIGEDITLHTHLAPSLGRVKADPGQIEQVIMNLAVNARDAMAFGGDLTIETDNVDLDEGHAHTHATVKPGPHVMLAVHDTGVGMTSETQAHIFDPFFTTKETGKGTGLGLATVYGIVKQSGGSIWVYSEVGHGTIFKIYLPMVMDGAEMKTEVKALAPPAMGSETVLVVEDEERVRSLIRLALEPAGYTVLETQDAENALATCTSHDGPIQLLLTDVVMPKMSGPVVAKKVISLRPDIKVLYMSGYTYDAVANHGVAWQDTPFLQKPFSPAVLRRKVREVLSGKKN
jgi:two-component system, cell cycle sensor histidine kinase and response regulator CckA